MPFCQAIQKVKQPSVQHHTTPPPQPLVSWVLYRNDRNEWSRYDVKFEIETGKKKIAGEARDRAGS